MEDAQGQYLMEMISCSRLQWYPFVICSSTSRARISIAISSAFLSVFQWITKDISMSSVATIIACNVSLFNDCTGNIFCVCKRKTNQWKWLVWCVNHWKKSFLFVSDLMKSESNKMPVGFRREMKSVSRKVENHQTPVHCSIADFVELDDKTDFRQTLPLFNLANERRINVYWKQKHRQKFLSHALLTSMVGFQVCTMIFFTIGHITQNPYGEE